MGESAAGGWGALASSAKHVLGSGDALRVSKALTEINQADGFDCPGCAWPELDDAGAFEFCENGVKAIAAEATGRRVGAEFFSEHSIADLQQRSDHWLEDQGRLTQPMVRARDASHYTPISWPAAFALLGKELRALDNPDQAVFYTSGRTSNEAAFLYQLFGRMLGTNNFPDCSNMCHESSGRALTESVGIGKGTVLLEDFAEADLILVIGQNPGTNHPRMLSTLQAARRRGADLISINPLREKALVSFVHPQDPVGMAGAATPMASLHVRPLIGSDMALFWLLIKAVLAAEKQEGGIVDHAFIAQHCDGYEAMVAMADDLDATELLAETGLAQTEVDELSARICGAKRIIACWAMGLTQHKHAVPTLQTLVNLMLMRGQIGRPGAGLCPVRGHSNVQGDRTVGITERPSPAFLQALGDYFNFTPPQQHGHDVVSAIEAMHAGDAKVFVGMGGNFVAAAPDTAFTAAALERCSLTVQVSTKLNRSHLHHGQQALILPCLARSEVDRQAAGPQAVSVEDSMSMVHASRGSLAPAGSALLSEPAIVAGMADAALGSQAVDWQALVSDYAHIRDAITAVVPGFKDYNTRLRQPRGFHLGNSARDREWRTSVGKARFMAKAPPRLALPADQLRLMTIRSHDQYNTTIYGMNDRYRGIRGERRVVFVHADDLAGRQLRDGSMVDLVSCYADGERRVCGFRCVAYDLPRGCAAAYFPETNPLISLQSYADDSRTPTSKFVPVRLEPARS